MHCNFFASTSVHLIRISSKIYNKKCIYLLKSKSMEILEDISIHINSPTFWLNTVLLGTCKGLVMLLSRMIFSQPLFYFR